MVVNSVAVVFVQEQRLKTSALGVNAVVCVGGFS